MIHLIKQDRPADQRYNAYYFILDEQWFCLKVHDMRSTLANAVLENHRSQTTPGTTMTLITSPPPSMRSPIYTELASFRKSIKREASSYSTLKDERYFDKFEKDLFITAESHDVSEILDPTFTPGSSAEEKGEMLEAKQVFMYTVFNETLLTDMGRTKVRKYLKTTDAQAVWKEYSEYMTTASKGASEKRNLTQHVTNTVLDSPFRGTSQQFVLHFNEQFRRLDELTDLAEKMPESIKMALLQNAVNDISQLSIVETLDEYTSTTSGAGSSTQLTYTSYYNLLINACIRYDATNTSTTSKRRNVYTAAGAQDLNAIKNPTNHTSIMTLTNHQMTFIRYTKPNKASYHLHPYLGFRQITPESQPPLQPKSLSKPLMALYMSLQKFISSSAQRLLLFSRNTILRPSTKLLRKGGFMSLTLLTMNQPHLKIPHMRSNLIPIHLMIHPQMSWTNPGLYQ